MRCGACFAGHRGRAEPGDAAAGEKPDARPVFFMGRRRVHVPKALRKQVLFLVLELLDLKNPTEVAVGCLAG